MQLEGLLFSIPWIAVMMYSLFRLFPSISRTQLILLFSIKILFTFLLQAIYTYHFEDRSVADIYRFFDDGIILNQVFWDDPKLFLKIVVGLDGGAQAQMVFESMNSWIKPFDSGFYNDNHIMIKLNAIMAFVSFGFYEVHGLLFSFFSFIGLVLIVQACLTQENRPVGYWLVILFPSSLLWISGGLKESLLVTALGITLFSLFTLRENRNRILILVIGVWLLLSIKVYFVLALAPALMAWYLGSTKKLAWWIQAPIWAGVLFTGVAVLKFVGFDTVEYVVRKQHEFLNHTAEINPGSAFEMEYLEYSIVSLIIHSPEALINSLIRPFLWEWKSYPELLMMAESLDVLFVLGLIAYHSIREKGFSKSTFWLLLFILPVLVLIGLTTPIFGAIMRYRAPCLIFLYIYSAPYIRQLLIRNSRA